MFETYFDITIQGYDADAGMKYSLFGILKEGARLRLTPKSESLTDPNQTIKNI